MVSPNILREPIGIIGAGAMALIHAHVLLQDGFTNVTLISRDKTVGGTWARHRVYPGLYINNIHGEYRFSSLEMPPPKQAEALGSRLSGLDLCNYMEDFSSKFLVGKAKFRWETEVLDVERVAEGRWHVHVEDHKGGAKETLVFSRILLATGGWSNPNIPAALSPEAARKAGFEGPVIHSCDFAERLPDILEAVKPALDIKTEEEEVVLVVGAGKSAQDMCVQLTKQGRKPVMVFQHAHTFTASKVATPDAHRRSRVVSVLSPHHRLNTRLERFLHTTTIGKWIVRSVFRKIEETSFEVTNVSKSSPLRPLVPLFWTVPSSDEGVIRPDSFHSLISAGDIKIIAPVRVVGYAEDGESVLLSNGECVKPKAVILATGYRSSWDKVITPATARELGMDRHSPRMGVPKKWDYKTLEDPPKHDPRAEDGVVTIHRSIVPAKNLEKRDFAIVGALFSANPGYSNEIAAHWVASYFRNDAMYLPTPEEAEREAEELAAWNEARFPTIYGALNKSDAAGPFSAFTWPQAADEMLEDMGLPSMRSAKGGNWFTWALQPVDSAELATLTEERRVRREEALVEWRADRGQQHLLQESSWFAQGSKG